MANYFDYRKKQGHRPATKNPRSGLIRLEDLDGFSEELREKLSWIMGNE